MTDPLQSADEGAHEPGPEQLWSESWYFDFAVPDGSLGGYVRLGLYPNLGTAWYWACLVGPGRPLVIVVDHEVPLPRAAAGSLEIRGHQLWADHVCEDAFDHWTVANETYAVGLDDPADAYGRMHGDRVPIGFDLEWETDGQVYPYPGVPRYEVPCRVHGEILVGDEQLELDGFGQRDHSWGVRDWWAFAWSWTAGRLDDGTRFHGIDLRIPGLDFVAGYVQPGEPIDAVTVEEELGDVGLPLRAGITVGPLALDVTPIAFAPVLLTGPDGRVSRFPRALCRFEDRARPRAGHGWTEWNQPAHH